MNMFYVRFAFAAVKYQVTPACNCEGISLDLFKHSDISHFTGLVQRLHCADKQAVYCLSVSHSVFSSPSLIHHFTSTYAIGTALSEISF